MRKSVPETARTTSGQSSFVGKKKKNKTIFPTSFWLDSQLGRQDEGQREPEVLNDDVALARLGQHYQPL